jgi:uncharacterized protein (TIGR02757 family)
MTSGTEEAAGAAGRHLADVLDELRLRYNRREFVHPDPLEFLYAYDDARDREVVGLIASSLAYGNVKQIVRSVARVLARIGRPTDFLRDASRETLLETFADFRHRMTSGKAMALLLLGVKRVIERHGSLEACFKRGLADKDQTVLPALSAFVEELTRAAGECPAHLLAVPARGSACKRLHLFLRWMVRRDEVDPGGWTCVSPRKLIVPLDTHMHRICRMLALTGRRCADMRTALEATAAFRTFAPGDPVRYDFALTRLGIRDDTDLEGFIRSALTNRAAPAAAARSAEPRGKRIARRKPLYCSLHGPKGHGGIPSPFGGGSG